MFGGKSFFIRRKTRKVVIIYKIRGTKDEKQKTGNTLFIKPSFGHDSCNFNGTGTRKHRANLGCFRGRRVLTLIKKPLKRQVQANNRSLIK